MINTYIQDVLLIIILLSQAAVFYSLIKLNDKINILINVIGKNQEKANEYLRVIAEQRGYR